MARHSTRAALGLILLAASSSLAVSAEPTDAAPRQPGFQVDPTSPSGGTSSRRVRLGRDLTISGSVLLASGYLENLIMTSIVGLSCPAEPGETLCASGKWAWGFLPVAGPWVQLGYEHQDANTTALYAVPAVVQTVGLGLLIAGIVTHHKYAWAPTVNASASRAKSELTLRWTF